MAPLLHFLVTLSLSFFFPSASSSPSDPASMDEIALLSIKRSISLDPYALLSNWDPATADHCEWRGVACAGSGRRVSSLNLTAGGLAGTLPSDLGNLTELRYLSLSYNAFSAEIPAAALGSLSHLEVLELRGNNFSGNIPDEISSLPSLRVVDLAYNSLSGPIPANLIGFSPVESVDLSFNQLSGVINISSSAPCRFLAHLKLSSNLLVGWIPPQIGKCSNLSTLLLDRNILEGRIPADLGSISGLRILDVSRNSLTGRIPWELRNCSKLSVLVLTNLIYFGSAYNSSMVLYNDEEFNAFVGAIPSEIISIPSLEILWAPRANLDGQLPSFRNGSCSLRILNLAENYISNAVPQWLGMCKSLVFLDLSSNYLQGLLPVSLGVGCMIYFNVSRNSLSGPLLEMSDTGCSNLPISDRRSHGLLEKENLLISYYENFIQSVQRGNPFGPVLDDRFAVLHDFSWNDFTGSLPSFSLTVESNFSYGLLLNDNGFNGSIFSGFFGFCRSGRGFAVNLSDNYISGSIEMLTSCSLIESFEAANNQFSGLISSVIGSLHFLKHLDLRGNYLNGPIPDQIGELKVMKEVLLGKNNLSGEIPVQLGDLTSLRVLELSRNWLTGNIPSALANAQNLEVLLLDHNRLSGSIPTVFSALSHLTMLDLSFNNLSGGIPHLKHPIDCEFFMGNSFLQPCPDPNASSPFGDLYQNEVPKLDSRKTRLKSFLVATVASVCVIVCVLMVLFLFLCCGRRKLAKITSLRRKLVVTFSDTPTELTYDNVVRATGNFSIQNLIGTGGFGATYKAELLPGYLVAVKRLSIGKFQGLQQFDAEIRTLGRIRHKNLVTLIGYHMGDIDTFLIYNYLSGGNLETFIRNMSSRKVCWLEVHKIALDVAQALSYLHYSCVPRIVHRDIKPSNILLDEKLNAYLSDFGLARLLEVSQTHATTDVAGTFGYVAPEYATTCRVSDKADVYSFGVVLLELISGKRSLDPSFSNYGNGFTIVAWAGMLIQEERAGELFYSGLWESGPKDKLVEMLRLAFSCTAESVAIRPSMKHVVAKLKQLKNH
ncbi:LRR receptor-like serine/threonine-protein kinase RPK2 [Typha latifolia]|uniref:LRR receptor-like serine/threonine-protein kinase RPK2 n=1 Tax=Typha latifolia TaxID=4733 RepID=UPI003C2CB175